MYKVILLDIETNKTFEKQFNSEYKLRNFINKVKRGKKLKILGVVKEY